VKKYDLIVVGSGGAGMMSAIISTRAGKDVLLLEKLPKVGAKLKATGGGRCNLTNTLSNEDFMSSFGRDGRFMSSALDAFDHKSMIAFFKEIGVDTHAPDGFRVFPVTHNSSTIIGALSAEMERLGVEVMCSQKVETLRYDDDSITGVHTSTDTFMSSCVVIATGGLGYPTLGAQGDGYGLSRTVGHSVTELFPAMIPLHSKERWVENCRADTMAKVTLRVDLPKAKKLRSCGDLIFTKKGIRGPVVLDFAREITPLLETYGEVPLLMNLTGGMNEDSILKHIKTHSTQHPEKNTLALVHLLLPLPLSQALCALAQIDATMHFKRLDGIKREALIKILAWTPLTIIGHDGFDMAMITRGGVSLKEIDPKTLMSKKIKGLYFCGEVMNLDGPCGGYNLQWAFSSGFIAGHLGEI